MGRQNTGLLHHGGHALGVQHGHQRLTGADGLQRLLGVKGGICPEGPGGGPEILLVVGRIGPQAVLHPVADLAEHHIGQVGGLLRDEPHRHAFGADQTHHLLHLLQQGLGRVLEQQVRLIKEERQLGLVQVTRLGQQLIQLSEHPQHKGGIQQRVEEQLPALQNVHDAPAGPVPVHPVGKIQVRLAEKQLAALVLQLEQRPLDGAHRLRRDVAVGQLVLLGVVAHILGHGPQVLQLQQQQAVVVRNAEDDPQHPALGVVEVQQAGQQLRPHLADGGADGMAQLSVHIKKAHGIAPVREIPQAHAVDGPADVLGLGARAAHTGEVALHVGQKHRHAHVAEGFGQHLQGDRLSGAGGAGDEPVAVGHGGFQINGGLAGGEPDLVLLGQIHKKASLQVYL